MNYFWWVRSTTRRRAVASEYSRETRCCEPVPGRLGLRAPGEEAPFGGRAPVPAAGAPERGGGSGGRRVPGQRRAVRRPRLRGAQAQGPPGGEVARGRAGAGAGRQGADARVHPAGDRGPHRDCPCARRYGRAHGASEGAWRSGLRGRSIGVVAAWRSSGSAAIRSGATCWTCRPSRWVTVRPGHTAARVCGVRTRAARWGLAMDGPGVRP